MATVIDALLINIGVDASKAVKGAKETEKALDGVTKAAEESGKAVEETGKAHVETGKSAVESAKEAEKSAKTTARVQIQAIRGTRELGRAGKEAAQHFASMRREVAGALALFTGGRSLIGLATSSAAQGVATGNTQRLIGSSAQTVNGLSLLSRQAGGSGGELASFLQSINNKSTTNEGLTELRQIGTQFGFDFMKNGKIDPELLQHISQSQKFRQLPPQAQMEAIRRAGGNETVWAALSSQNFTSDYNNLSRTGQTNAQVKQSQEFTRHLTALKGTGSTIGATMGEGAQDVLDPIVRGLNAIASTNPQAIGQGLNAVAIALAAISGVGMVKMLARFAPLLRFLPLAGEVAAGGAAVAGGAISAPVVAGVGVAAGAGYLGYEAYKHSDSVGKLFTGTKDHSPRQAIIDNLKARGFSNVAIAGVLARVQKESGFNPHNDKGDSGLAYGLLQWHPSRQRDFAKLMGHSIRGSSADEQAYFIGYELTHKEIKSGKMLRAAKNAREAGFIASHEYARPMNALKEARETAAEAAKIAPSLGSSNVHIGTIQVNTNSDNPHAHARAIRDALKDHIHTGGGGQH